MIHRILVIDDEPGVRDALVDLLTAFGHHAESAGNGNEALSLLTERSYALILTDLRMPEMDGEVLYQKVAQMWPHLASRVAFVTGEMPFPTFALHVDVGKVPILRRPFTLGGLRQLVDRMLA